MKEHKKCHKCGRTTGSWEKICGQCIDPYIPTQADMVQHMLREQLQYTPRLKPSHLKHYRLFVMYSEEGRIHIYEPKPSKIESYLSASHAYLIFEDGKLVGSKLKHEIERAMSEGKVSV